VVDEVMMRIVDVMYALPFIFFVILLMVTFGSNIVLIFVAIGAVEWLTMSRIVRGQTLSLKQKEFIEAARAAGLTQGAIIVRHIVPNLLGPVMVYVTLTIPAVILSEELPVLPGPGRPAAGRLPWHPDRRRRPGYRNLALVAAGLPLPDHGGHPDVLQLHR